MLIYRRRNENGFSLTEMIVVLIIGGILIAIAIPGFMTWVPKYRVNGAARMIFSDLMTARAKGISDNNDYVVTFNVAGGFYTIHDNKDNDNPPVQDEGENVRTVVLADHYPGIEFGYIDSTGPDGEGISGSVTFPHSPPRITFRPSGLTRDLDKGEIYLKPTDDEKRERQRCISVLGTGPIKVYKHTGSAWE